MSGIFHIHFYRAPISKLLSLYVFSSHILLQYRPPQSLKCSIPRKLDSETLLQILWSKVGFIDRTYAVLAIVLLYQFRIFERRYGSLKFSSHLLSFFVLSVTLEAGLSALLRSDGYLSNGPFGIFVPWFVSFYYEIPPLLNSLGGVISQKLKVYLIGILLFALSLENSVAFMAAIFSGILCQVNFLWIRKFLRVPACLGSLLLRASWIVESPLSPQLEPLGATLEIQRAMQMEQVFRDRF
eukprot:TRINITY_DN4519_c0_g1_i1.p1 TRINITY_DN4519_c0_g1~~TRINITY_DN4519_c0_g1_i1.p1  ORF type:complete len:240 (-),score=34.22 TRINITY_DN4519_c0_g1_i1:301-1020(-)